MGFNKATLLHRTTVSVVAAYLLLVVYNLGLSVNFSCMGRSKFKMIKKESKN